MSKITSVENVQAFEVSLPSPLNISEVFILASGKIPTSGWTNPRLVPRIENTSLTKSNIWNFDFVADAPTGIVLQVELPISAIYMGKIPSDVKSIRVYGELGKYVEAQLQGNNKLIPSPSRNNRLLFEGIFNQSIGIYDDSHQPTGTIIWINDGPLGIPTPHIEMKKLQHTLTLVVEGPSDEKIRECVNQSLTAGVIVGLAAAFASGGMAGLGAGASVFLDTLLGCLGSGFTANLVDESHWVYWTT